jgi:hypothetical protein
VALDVRQPRRDTGGAQGGDGRIAREVWNKYCAPVFGSRDSVLLGIYSHMIHSFLYLPDYPIGRHDRAPDRGTGAQDRRGRGEIERMSRIGNISPDLWMRQATGAPVGAAALLAADRAGAGQLE